MSFFWLFLDILFCISLLFKILIFFQFSTCYSAEFQMSGIRKVALNHIWIKYVHELDSQNFQRHDKSKIFFFLY